MLQDVKHHTIPSLSASEPLLISSTEHRDPVETHSASCAWDIMQSMLSDLGSIGVLLFFMLGALS